MKSELLSVDELGNILLVAESPAYNNGKAYFYFADEVFDCSSSLGGIPIRVSLPVLASARAVVSHGIELENVGRQPTSRIRQTGHLFQPSRAMPKGSA